MCHVSCDYVCVVWCGMAGLRVGSYSMIVCGMAWYVVAQCVAPAEYFSYRKINGIYIYTVYI